MQKAYHIHIHVSICLQKCTDTGIETHTHADALTQKSITTGEKKEPKILTANTA